MSLRTTYNDGFFNFILFFLLLGVTGNLNVDRSRVKVNLVLPLLDPDVVKVSLDFCIL